THPGRNPPRSVPSAAAQRVAGFSVLGFGVRGAVLSRRWRGMTMTLSPALRALAAAILPLFAAVLLAAMPGQAAPADPSTPFANLPGRWVGQGRLGIKDNKPEMVKCRVTYLSGATADDIKQSIRCASAGGKIEVKSEIVHSGGTLSGSW